MQKKFTNPVLTTSFAATFMLLQACDGSTPPAPDMLPTDPCSTETADRPQTRYPVSAFSELPSDAKEGVAADEDGACLSLDGVHIQFDGDRWDRCTSDNGVNRALILVDQY